MYPMADFKPRQCHTATPTHARRTVAELPAKLIEMCYRFGVHKGEAVRLDWALGARAPSSELVSAPRELEQALLCGRWRFIERSKFKSVCHINVQEMKVAVKQLKSLLMVYAW